MEFKFNVNPVLGDAISVFDGAVMPYRKHSSDSSNQLFTIIDEMGRSSAKAQGLRGPITSASKLRLSDHRLYVMKDAESNKGLGAVIGILKVGRKRLFIVDIHNTQNEMEPLCVLDFYVHESCQRKGYGKKLFEYMLKAESVRPQHLAIDRPSSKFTSFLMKHYKLRTTISQVNHFVVFDGFFSGQPDFVYVRKKSRFSVNKRPPLPPRAHSRDGYASRIPEVSADILNNVRPVSGSAGVDRSTTQNTAGNILQTPQRPHSRQSVSSQGLGAQANKYSRYGNNPLSTPPATRRQNSYTKPSDSAFTRNSPILGGSSGSVVPSNTVVTRDATPPFGRAANFELNTHLQTQTRDGHLKLAPTATVVTQNTSSPSSAGVTMETTLPGTKTQSAGTTPTSQKTSIGRSEEAMRNVDEAGNYCLSNQEKRVAMDSSWNVLGVPPRHPTTATNNPQYYNSRNSHWAANRFW
ncbi:uncharacterized protein LOC100372923 [Saccoglossus kowalevskii]|uniref:Alpha-tubulin N-acetyltransferase n=1 Tax=Saccoglossus kowalevskii TaxID=10224 RepID=A0ABM0MEI1_SACKO|nr:PREDICTED: alpha-tubulin N-acetyltransferase-like [Saccoglossus kowalevskii]